MTWLRVYRVYRVNRDTGERTVVKPLRTVKPAETPDPTSTFPKCECPMHRKAGGASRGT